MAANTQTQTHTTTEKNSQFPTVSEGDIVVYRRKNFIGTAKYRDIVDEVRPDGLQLHYHGWTQNDDIVRTDS